MNSNVQRRPRFSFRDILGPDHERYEGVYMINIHLLRFLYLLMAVFVGSASWNAILTHQGPWDPMKAVVFCVWAAY